MRLHNLFFPALFCRFRIFYIFYFTFLPSLIPQNGKRSLLEGGVVGGGWNRSESESIILTFFVSMNQTKFWVAKGLCGLCGSGEAGC
jgi:hypothetical protein